MKLNIAILYFYTTEFLLLTYVKSNGFIPNEIDNIYNIIGAVTQRCFDTKTLLLGNWSDDVSTILLNLIFSSSNPVSVMKITKNSILRECKSYRKVYAFNESHLKVKNYPISNVLVSFSSEHDLEVTLINFRVSIWWNNAAYFLLINKNIENTCQSAYTYLNILWNFNVLSAIYFCKDSHRRLFIYAFNPFTYLAPRFWKAIDSNDSWTLLRHSIDESFITHFRKDGLICDLLYYDKGKNLNGYTLKLVANLRGKSTRLNLKNSGFDRYNGLFYQFFNVIIGSMNATITVKDTNISGYVDDQGEPRGSLRDVMHSLVDCHLSATIFAYHWPWRAYPFGSTGLKIVSLKQPLNFIARFLNIFSYRVWLIYAITCVILIVALKYLLKHNVSTVTLEFVRAFVNSSTLREPDHSFSKIFFAAFIFFVFGFSTFMQGHLTSSTTLMENAPSVNTIEDLIKSNLKVYGGSTYYQEMLVDTPLYNNFQPLAFSECIKLIKKRKRVACMIGAITLRYYAYESRYAHISKNTLAFSSITYIFREDWPLNYKFDWILLKISEGGFLQLYNEREELYYMKDFDDHDAKATTLEDISIGLFILLGGWVMAIFALWFEYILYSINLFKVSITFSRIKVNR